ncbi:PhoH family protein [Desulfatitalea tepidiphila]|uniref:PhoH family protein n=1 Tax=Desulfatitalea tepidiphila TaxID=1185843 RepID=UPI0009FB0ADA
MSVSDYQTKITFSDVELSRQLFGEHNGHLQRIAQALSITIQARGSTAHLQGEEISVRLAQNLMTQLYGLLKAGYPIYATDIDYAIRVLSADDRARLKDIFLDTVYITAKKLAITPKSRAQKEYIDAIRQHDIVFGIGPAGTGKTYLAMAMAVASLSKGQVSRIILTRPAVEAGEALGFLPGDLAEKVDPYLRPLYDALHDMLRFEKVTSLMQQGAIEVAPIAFMRGRTLNDSFIILDEAQNTTSEQMKMFLTRIGFSSKAVITGDITQIDLPPHKTSGLIEAKDILADIEGIRMVFFSQRDVVRHRLVQEIIQAYESATDRKALTPNGVYQRQPIGQPMDRPEPSKIDRSQTGPSKMSPPEMGQIDQTLHSILDK